MLEKVIQTLTFTLLTMTNSYGQDCDEYLIHLKSVDTLPSSANKSKIAEKPQNHDLSFIDFTIENLLSDPSDSCFISNRTIMRKFNTTHCDSNRVIIQDSFSSGEMCVITLKAEEFEPDKHEIIYNEDSTRIEKIDNQFPFGGQYVIPKISLTQLDIKVNDRQIKIPSQVYKNLYHPNLCDTDSFMKEVEAYESLNGEFLYLYIFGGNAASVYFSKLIFDKKGYITKIISDYYPLSINSAFRDEFIGF